MKIIKLHFVGFWKDFSFDDNMFVNILKKRYVVVNDSINPDFLICSPLCKPFEYMKYDCPRIMYTGEFISPDFTAIDYFIGFDDIQFGDRALRFPLFLYSRTAKTTKIETLDKDAAAKELKSKEYFCNYIFGHDTALGKREAILEQLQKYKRVECAGTHRNNMPNGQTFNMATKRAFMRKCKFTIAAESVCYPGFTSEKIGHAYNEYTIPIYFGDPDILKVFNKSSFVDCYNNSIETAIEKVIEIDNNDDLYIDMLCENRYNIANYEEHMYEKLEAFLYNIFDQDKDMAYRRPRFYRSGEHESYLKEYNKLQNKLSYKIFKKTGI
ncbi:MAG: hypothetical protein IKU23_03475 [Clostridia bacterium]|nr:hypothetical protein [Clostridia bacterium]